MLFVSLVTLTHAGTGNSETGGANRDELLKEKAIFGQQHYLTLVATTNSADVFSLFSNYLTDWSDLLPLSSSNQFFDTVSL